MRVQGLGHLLCILPIQTALHPTNPILVTYVAPPALPGVTPEHHVALNERKDEKKEGKSRRKRKKRRKGWRKRRGVGVEEKKGVSEGGKVSAEQAQGER